MSQTTKILTNPIVLGGGALLGIVLLLNKNGATAPKSSGFDPVVINATVAMNRAALDSESKIAQINGDVAKAKIAGNVAQTGFLYNLLNTQAQAGAIVERDRVLSGAGIVNNIVTQQSAVVIDAQTNMARIELANVDARKAVAVTKLTTDSANYIAKKQADASIIGNIFGGVTKAIGAVATGGASLAIPAIGSIGNGGGSIPSQTFGGLTGIA
jgi:hypothetical protein